jgi:hypothetical protein
VLYLDSAKFSYSVTLDADLQLLSGAYTIPVKL